jgi:hypothetical protein
VRNAYTDSVVASTGAKRERPQSKKAKADSIYQDMLDFDSQNSTYVSEDEKGRLEWFLEHSRLDAWEVKSSNMLHFLWLGIGS